MAVGTIVPIATIFHPSDFSEGSEVAFAHALRIALAARARLDVLHASDERRTPWTEFPRVRAMLERWGMLPPNSPKEAVPAMGIEVMKVTARDDDPVRAAERFLEKHPPDLVVLAAHADGGRMRWLRDSISQPIAEAAGSAALFLPYGSEGFISRADGGTSLRNVLIPIDSEPDPARAIDAACRLALAIGSAEVSFTLLHVGAAGEAPAVRVEERPGWSWRRVSRDGDVVETIVAAARECAADLIVMATAGRHGFLDALRGSTTEQVLRSGAGPLLAIPQAAHG